MQVAVQAAEPADVPPDVAPVKAEDTAASAITLQSLRSQTKVLHVACDC